MKKLFIVFILLLAIGVSFGQQKEPEMVTVPKSMLNADQKAKIEVKEKVKSAKEWGGIGQEIGEGATAIFDALNRNAVEFGESTPGMALIGILAWKVIGTDFLQMLVGIPLWLIGTLLFTYSYIKTCIPRKILKKKTLKKEGKLFNSYDKEYEIINRRAEGSNYDSSKNYERVGHVLFYFGFIGLCAAILFA